MSDDSGAAIELTSLQSISRGASLFIVGKVILDVLEFVLNLVLTRTLGSSLYGVFAYANTLVMIALVFTSLGSDNALLKYVPQYEDDEPKQRLFVGLAYATSVIASVVVAAGLFAFASPISRYTLNEPLLVDVLRLFAVLLIFDTLVKILNTTFRSLEVLEYQVLIENLAKPTCRLVAVGVALIAGLPFFGVMASLVVASALVFVFAVYLFLTRVSLRPSIRSPAPTRRELVEYYNFSVPLMVKDAGGILRRRVDVLMVGFFLSSTAVGIYNVTLLIAGMLSLPLAAINQLFPPVAARLYSNGDLPELNAVFSIVTRWAFTVSLFLGLVAIVYRTELLALFGSEFTAGASVLVFFVFSGVIGTATGPSGYVLMISEHQYVLLANQWVFGVLNVFLNYWFILEFGLIGAAFATATVGILVNVARVLEIWYLEGLYPYTWNFVKPLAAGAVSAVVMYAVSYLASGLTSVASGFLLGLGGYVVVLVLLGIDRQDRAFFSTTIAPALHGLRGR